MAAYPDNVDYSTFPPSLSLRYEGTTYVGGVCDLDPTFTPISGARAVAEHVARRLISPPGSFDDPDYGFDIKAYLNANLLPAEVGEIEAAISGEALQVEGVEAADVTVTLKDNQLRCLISLTMTDLDSYNFVFVLDTDTVFRVFFPLS